MVEGSASTPTASAAPSGRLPRAARTLRAERSTVALVSIAVAVRLIWVARFAQAPAGLSDPVAYDVAAQSIAAGDGYRGLLGNFTAYFPPGYPYALGWLYRVADAVGLDNHHPQVVGVVQSLLWGVTTGAVVIVGRRVGGRRCGVAAGAVIALWPNLITYSAVLLSESLFVALFACTLAALTVTADADAPMASRTFVVPIVLTGAFVGLMVMVRPQGVLGIPVAAIVWWWTGVGTKRAAAMLVSCAVGTAILVAPWAVRNSRDMGEPILMSTNSGDNLCIGYNPDATGAFGLYLACETGDNSPDGPEFELRRSGENQRRALEYIRSEPEAVPGLAVKKLLATYRTDEDGLRANDSFGELPILSPGWRSGWLVFTQFGYVLIGVATVAGTARGVRRVRRDGRRAHPQLLVLFGLGIAGLIVPMMFFGDPRFKVASTPVYAVFAGLGIVGFLDYLRHRSGVASANDHLSD